MLIINFIDKDRVQGDEGFSGDSRAVWHARLTLFIGFALMAGGLAGSVVRLPSLYSFREILETQPYPPPGNVFPTQAVLVLKYILHSYPEQYLYYGYANVSQNVALMLSAIVLWISQSVGSEYEYHLSI